MIANCITTINHVNGSLLEHCENGRAKIIISSFFIRILMAKSEVNLSGTLTLKPFRDVTAFLNVVRFKDTHYQ